MDNIDKLKKRWQELDQKYPKLNKKELYQIIHSKSSSIVKWIFRIGVLEFLFWIVLSLLIKDSDEHKEIITYGAYKYLVYVEYFNYAVIICFMAVFYKNYKNISVLENSKKLIQSILKTRNTVKYYVLYNILIFGASVVYGVLFVLKNSPEITFQIKNIPEGEIQFFYGIVILVTIVAVVICSLIMLGVYYLLYGILVKKLYANYKELKVIEEME